MKCLIYEKRKNAIDVSIHEGKIRARHNLTNSTIAVIMSLALIARSFVVPRSAAIILKSHTSENV
jgi:hypothetical protein